MNLTWILTFYIEQFSFSLCWHYKKESIEGLTNDHFQIICTRFKLNIFQLFSKFYFWSFVNDVTFRKNWNEICDKTYKFDLESEPSVWCPWDTLCEQFRSYLFIENFYCNRSDEKVYLLFWKLFFFKSSIEIQQTVWMPLLPQKEVKASSKWIF